MPVVGRRLLPCFVRSLHPVLPSALPARCAAECAVAARATRPTLPTAATATEPAAHRAAPSLLACTLDTATLALVASGKPTATNYAAAAQYAAAAVCTLLWSD